jgi:hypothetical protein
MMGISFGGDDEFGSAACLAARDCLLTINNYLEIQAASAVRNWLRTRAVPLAGGTTSRLDSHLPTYVGWYFDNNKMTWVSDFICLFFVDCELTEQELDYLILATKQKMFGMYMYYGSKQDAVWVVGHDLIRAG